MKSAYPLAFVLLAASAPAATADMPQVQPGRYRCSSPGAGSDRAILPLQPGRELRVAFRLARSSAIRRTLAFIRFEGPHGPSRIAVGKARTDRPRMYAAVHPPGTGIEDPIYYFRFPADWIILRLALDDRGVLTVRSNQLARQFKWGTVARATLGCQAGEWEIDVWPRSYVTAAGALT
ncbi:MAG: hypothetical protein ACJ8D6_05165 [Sphingomicrobium sp.]